KEGVYLNSKNGQTQIGTAIADAILEYKKVLWVKAPEDVKKPIVPQPETATTELPATTEQTTPKTTVGSADKTDGGVSTETPPSGLGANEQEVSKPVKIGRASSR